MGKAIVVNVFAGPGAGKSTMMAHIFALLKWAKVNCEMAPEYAKDRVWQKDFKVFESQPYVFGKQFLRINRPIDEVDVIITDSPLLLSTIYDNTSSEHFAPFVLEAFNSFNNLNYFITRQKDYNPSGRMQTADEAAELDTSIRGMLDGYQVPYKVIEGSPFGVRQIVKEILAILRK